MPGKARRKRGRQPPTRKTRIRRPIHDAAPATVSAESDESVMTDAPSNAVAPVVGVSSKGAAAQTPIRHSHIGAELRTIGILAVLMVIVLVVLKLVIG